MNACPIALIGISGAGKSTVARLVAEQLGWRWADSDRELERETGRIIPEIFATDGEPAFRELEAATIARLLSSGEIVVATGGGAPTSEAGRRALADCTAVWLRLSPEEAHRRLAANPETEKRPLLAGDALERLRTLAREREPRYRAAADVTIDVDSLAPADVAAAIVAAVVRIRKGVPA